MADINIAVSVIIPMFNVEKYLPKCLETVEKQTFKDTQVILINDGTKDKCGEIAKEFVARNANFEYYEIENRGLSGARNYGLTKAKGEYVAFVDSDDYLAENYIERLYTTAKEKDADVVFCNYRIYYEARKVRKKMVRVKFRKHREKTYTPHHMCKSLLHDFYARSYAWNKIYKRELFVKNQIEYPKMFLEDLPTTLRICFFANKIVVINDLLYVYRVRKNSIMTSFNEVKMNDYILSYGLLSKFLYNNAENLKKYRVGMIRFSINVIFAHCFYWIPILHRRNRTFRGIFKNYANTIKSVIYFSQKKFQESEEKAEVKLPIFKPQPKKPIIKVKKEKIKKPIVKVKKEKIKKAEVE